MLEPLLSPLVAVAALVPLLAWLKRWIQERLQQLGAWLGAPPYLLAYLLFLPGIALHELSHWVTARLLGVRTGRVGLWPRREQEGWVRLGYVEIEPCDPLRESLIGLAPLASGMAAVLLISGQVARLGQLEPLIHRGDLLAIWRGLAGVPDLGIWLYLIFATSNAMMPSPSDRRPWLWAGLFLAGLAVLSYLAGLSLPAGSAAVIGQGLRYLALALAVTAAVDALFAVGLGLVGWALSGATG